MALTKETFELVTQAALKRVAELGAGYFGWKNSPEFEDGSWKSGSDEISAEDAAGVFKQKIDSGYSERFVMSLGTVASLISNGYNVRLVQFEKEEGVPFDASGWLVIAVEGMPIFHVSPDDLDSSGLEDIVEVLSKNNEECGVKWQGTNKVGEFTALLRGSLEPGLDLVAIAKEHS